MKLSKHLLRILCASLVASILFTALSCKSLTNEKQTSSSSESVTASVKVTQAPNVSVTTGTVQSDPQIIPSVTESSVPHTVPPQVTTTPVTENGSNGSDAPVVTDSQASSVSSDSNDPVITTTGTTTNNKDPLITTKPDHKDPIVTDKSEIQAQIDKISKKYSAMGVSVAIIDGGVVSDAYQYGWQVKDEIPMSEQTKIRAASLSKVVLTMLAMQMVDDGTLDLDAPLEDYLGVDVKNPYYPDEVITVRDLFSHVSSLSSKSYVDTYEKILNRFSSSSMYREVVPGDVSGFMYNNYAFAILGTMMDKINGKTLTKYANQTLFTITEVTAAYQPGEINREDLALLYETNHDVSVDFETLESWVDSDVLGASSKFYAGGLTISATDLAKLVSVLANDGMYGDTRVLSEDAVTEMEKVIFHYKGGGYDFDQALTLRYQSGMYGREGLYYHTGSAYGVHSFLSYDPITKSGIVVITTGTPAEKDKYDIYKVCGEISEYFYKNVLS